MEKKAGRINRSGGINIKMLMNRFHVLFVFVIGERIDAYPILGRIRPDPGIRPRFQHGGRYALPITARGLSEHTRAFSDGYRFSIDRASLVFRIRFQIRIIADLKLICDADARAPAKFVCRCPDI